MPVHGIDFAGRQFVDGLGFDHYTMKFKHDPKLLMPWPAGENVSDEPKPTPGQKQTYVLEGLEAGSTVCLAIRSWDASHNRSPISNVVKVTVK